MVPDPVGQFGAADATSSEVEHKTLLLIDGGVDVRAIEQKKGGHCSVSHALVPVDKGVTLREREAQGGCLLAR